VSNTLSHLPAAQPSGPKAPALEPVGWPSDPQWHPEHDPSSTAALEIAGGRVGLSFELGGGERNSQFAAAALDLPAGMPAFDGVTFDARASQPMRVSVQLRFPDHDARWGKSIFVDGELRQVTLLTEDLLPFDPSAGPMPAPATARSLLLVVDLVNARPGDGGAFEVSDLTLGRR
jgi:hypothetical protein